MDAVVTGTAARWRRVGRRDYVLSMLLALLAVGTLVMVGCKGDGGQAAIEEAPSQIIKDITPQEAFELIQKEQASPDFAIIDVRTLEEFAGGHLEDALNIDFYAADFEDRLNELDKSGTYVIYCRSGRRSGTARSTMERLGFQEVYNVLGGINRWTDEGLPVVE